MLWIDLASILVVVAFAYRGAQRGAIWQLAGILAVALAVYLSSRWIAQIQDAFPPEISQTFRPLLAAILLYSTVSFVVYLIARKTRLWFENLRFLEFDRHWGAIFGAAKGAVIVLLVIIGVAVAFPSFRPLLLESKVGCLARSVVGELGRLLPDEIGGAVSSAFTFADDVE